MTRRPAARQKAPGTVRIIGGRWKRRSLLVVDAPGLRPTSDRVRETLFNWLGHAFGGLDGISVLDLFAGTGALGFEAASRGASSVTLVEADARAATELEMASSTLGATQVEVLRGDALRIATEMRDNGRRYDLVFLDPPFGNRWIEAILPLAIELCEADGYIYVEAEQAIAQVDASSAGLEIYRADKGGEVFYHLLRRNIKE